VIHEIKFDGYRLQIHLNKGKVKIFTRNGHDWTNRFHLIAESFDIPVERAVFDGEVVIKDGRTNFSELQLRSPAADRGAWRSMPSTFFSLKASTCEILRRLSASVC
jgi:ATP-dependent DNA ligase